MNKQITKKYKMINKKAQTIADQMIESMGEMPCSGYGSNLSNTSGSLKNVVDSFSKLTSCKKSMEGQGAEFEEQDNLPYPPEAVAMMQEFKPSDYEFLKEALKEVFKDELLSMAKNECNQ